MMEYTRLERKSTPQRGLLAVVQTTPRVGDISYNLAEIEAALKSLEAHQNRLIVYPEMATTGYFFNRTPTLNELAEPIPQGPTTQRLIALAEKYHAYLVVGMPELDGGKVYNSAVVVGPEGYLQKYQKLHLWSEEKLLYSPGQVGPVIVDLPFARLGLMICYDLWFPELIRILRILGADVIAVPAALVWNDTPAHARKTYYMSNYVGMAAAHLNQVHLALASQVGRYGDQWLFGSSFIAEPNGWLLQEPAGDQDPEIIQAEVDFTAGRSLRGWGEMDDFDADRRTDIYGPLLGYQDREGKSA